MEKLFLRAFLSSKKLNVINQQSIDRAVLLFKLIY